MAPPNANRRPTTKTSQAAGRWPQRRRLLWAAAPVVVAAIVGAALLLPRGGGSSPSSESRTTTGLPDTPDYHSLLVDPTDSEAITLGTHAGLFKSANGGRSWRPAELTGQDAMNLVRSEGAVLWAAGHSLLARSEDAGTTWQNVRPEGLPSLDLHGFTVSSGSGEIYAAVAGEGLYRSSDAGKSFTVASRQVGASVFGLAVMPGGEVLAADPGQGLLASSDTGQTWRRLVGGQIVGVAINPKNPRSVLATGQGIYRSVNAGRTWTRVLDIAEGAGPVAWSPSAANVAYVVGFDGTLHRTNDGGRSWRRADRGR